MNVYRITLAACGLFTAAACSTGTVGDGHATTETSATQCANDLDFAATFFLENDAGVRGMGWADYPASVNDVLQRERASAAQIQSVSECAASLNRFLFSIRTGHIAAIPAVNRSVALGGDPQYPQKVESRRLSDEMLYVYVPSCGQGIRAQLLLMIEDESAALATLHGLIIDLRRSGGGSDLECEPLFTLLGSSEYRVKYPDVLVTSANIAAWEAVVSTLTHPPTIQFASDVIQRMKDAGRGWVAMSDVPALESRYEAAEVKASPQHIVLLIGPECASACEQFVVTARQNPRVTLMGRHTSGALDASNLREAQTPSGQITLFYATTFVKRPPGQRIDGIGIAPDITLPPPDDEAAFESEVIAAQAFIEAEQAR